MEFNKTFGSYLREVRIAKGLSQMDIASLVGINAQNISAIERGEVAPTLFWITKLCEGLKSDPQEFINLFYNDWIKNTTHPLQQK